MSIIIIRFRSTSRRRAYRNLAVNQFRPPSSEQSSEAPHAEGCIETSTFQPSSRYCTQRCSEAPHAEGCRNQSWSSMRCLLAKARPHAKGIYSRNRPRRARAAIEPPRPMRRHDAERTDDLQPRPDALGADALGATPRSRRWIRERSATSLEAEAGHDQQCVHVSIAPPGRTTGSSCYSTRSTSWSLTPSGQPNRTGRVQAPQRGVHRCR